MADRTITTRLTLDPSAYESGMQRAARASQGLGEANKKAATDSRSAMQRMAQSARDQRAEWQQVGGTLAGVGAAITGLMGIVAATGIGYNNLRQTATQGLTAVTGSTEAAAEQMRKLDEYGQNSWLMRDSLIRAQQQMTGFGIETEKVIPYMDALAETVAATGGSSQTFEELAFTMSKVAGQGKITAQELNEFGQRGVDAATLIGEAMGKTGGQIRDEITEGTLDADAALDALAQGMVARYEGSSDLVRQTFRGAVDDVMAAFRDLSANAMSVFVDPEGGGLLVGLLNQLSDLLFWLRDLPGPILQVGAVLTGLGGFAALAAGGFMLLVPRLVETWDALGRMGSVGPAIQDMFRRLPDRANAAARSIGRFGAALTLAYAAFRGGQYLGTLIGDFNDAVPAVDLLTERLRNLSDEMSGYDAILGDLELGQFTDLEQTVEKLSNLSGFDQFVHNMEWAADRSHVAAEGLEAAGQALATMADQDYDAAAEAFRNLAMEAGGTDQAALALLDTMPAFRDHLEEVALAAGLGTEDFTLLKIAMGNMPPVVEEATGATQNYEGALSNLAAAQKEAKDQFDEWVDAMGNAADSFGGVIDGYEAAAEAAESSTASMSSWISELEKQAEAVQNWAENSLTASAQIRDDLPEDMHVAGQAMVNEMVLAGEDGARALQTFVDGTPEQRRQLIEAWQGTGYDIGVGLAHDMTSAPDGEVGANTFPAEQALAAFLGAVYNSEEFVTIDGNPVPAENVLSAVRQAILATDEPVTIDGNDVPANDVLNALMTAIRNEEEDVTIDGNRVPADQVVVELMAWVRQQEASVSVNADTSAAMSRLGVLDRTLNSINGKRVTATVAIVQQGQAAVASGGYMGHFPKFADGGSPRRVAGLLEGPGTTTSDSILARLSRKEFVVNAAATDYYSPAFMYALNARRIPKESLIQQYAGGGTPRHVTQYLPSPRATAPARVSLDGVRIRGRLDLGDGLVGFVDGRIEEDHRRKETW